MKGTNKRRLFDLLIITLFNNRIGRKKNMMQPIDNIKNNKISINSPLAKAVIGKEAGDVVEFETPGGLKSYEILKIEYV